jgi:hypothetical protein
MWAGYMVSLALRCVGPGVKLGLLRVGVSAPSASVRRLQLRHCLHMACCTAYTSTCTLGLYRYL